MIQILKITPLLLLLSACSTSTQQTLDLAALHDQTQKGASKILPLQTFKQNCLRGPGFQSSPQEARQNKWNAATDDALSQIGLSGLKKSILNIPGGGAPITETQSILITAESDTGTLVLNREEKFNRKIKTRELCEIYTTETEFLKTCAELGNLLGSAPTSNTKYERSNSHFISWATQTNKNTLTLQCSQTGDAEFKGIRLAASYSKPNSERKSIQRKTKSSQLPSGASAR